MPRNNRSSPANWVVVGIVVALVGAAVAYILWAQPKPVSDFNSSQQTGADTQQEQTPSLNQPSAETTVPGKYVDYSQETFNSDTSGRKLLFFHASWCPQCRALEEDIKASGVPDGMTIFKVNYDTATGLKQKYGVTLQTTLVEVDSNGNLIKKHVAYNEPTLSATLEALGN